MDIDSLDKKLLSELQADADVSTSALAEKLHISQSPCWRRSYRLEEAGVIRKKVALLD